MTPQGYGNANPYARQSVATATPAQLVLMLYDGALTALGKVRRAHTQGPAGAQVMNRELQRVQDIINELQVSLDHQKGHPIAGNLGRLYEYCQYLLVKMNVSKKLDKIDDVETIIQELRDAWEQACVNAPVAAVG